MKGTDVSYYYEGYSEYKTEDFDAAFQASELETDATYGV